jgi:hypothetical protein
VLRFVDELLARVRRAGAAGQILLRADSGFQNKKVTARLRERRCRYSIGVTMHKIVAARIALIADEDWQPVAEYPDTEEQASMRSEVSRSEPVGSNVRRASWVRVSRLLGCRRGEGSRRWRSRSRPASARRYGAR